MFSFVLNLKALKLLESEVPSAYIIAVNILLNYVTLEVRRFFILLLSLDFTFSNSTYCLRSDK